MRSRASSSGSGARPPGAALVVLLALAGCGAAPSRPPPRVAIMPVDTVGVPAAEGEALQGALARALAGSRAVSAVAVAPTPPAASQPAASQPVASRPAASQPGPPPRADLVLSLALAGLGDLRLVRSRLVRATDGLALQDLQETVQGGGPALQTYAGALARRLFPEGVRRPWYKQWWFYVAVAGVAAASAIGTWGAVYSRRHETGVVHLGDL